MIEEIVYLSICLFFVPQVHEELLSVGKPEGYKKAIQTTSGKLISDVVLQSLTRTERKLGVIGDTYLVEKEHYEEAMNTVFSNLLVRHIICLTFTRIQTTATMILQNNLDFYSSFHGTEIQLNVEAKRFLPKK